MSDEVETLVIGVRADTAAFARDLAAMRAELDGPFADGAMRAGRVLEGAMVRALRTGKLEFEDLKRIALASMAQIAGSALRSGIGSLVGGGSGGLAGAIGGLLAPLLGLPGRATGGPVSAGRAYLVGERGPELFVPTGAGRVEAGAPGGSRDVRVSITVNASAEAGPRALQASSRQVARAVRQTLAGMD